MVWGKKEVKFWGGIWDLKGKILKNLGKNSLNLGEEAKQKKGKVFGGWRGKKIQNFLGEILRIWGKKVRLNVGFRI